MQDTTINRREFVALSTAAVATTAISTTALAQTVSPIHPRKPLCIPAPSLARLETSKDDPTRARVLPYTASKFPTRTLTNPLLTLTPLPCVDGRLDRNASISIELHHPTPNIYSILYSAHNLTIPNQSTPSYASAIQTKAPAATATLRITQRIADRERTKLLTLNSSAPRTYLLAIPTATKASNASFRFTAAHLDSAANITKLTNPMPAASSRCAYFSITISDKSAGE